MRRIGLALLWCVWGLSLQAQTVTATWDAVAPYDGFHLLYGTAPGAYNVVVVLPAAPLSAVIPNLTIGQTYFAVVEATNGGLVSLASNEAFATVRLSDPSCTPPLGANAIAIFPTALQKTGSGGAGSKARIDFQVGSPGSPVTSVQVQAAGVPLGKMSGTDLGALAGLWFTVPIASGTYPLSIVAQNLYGCVQTQSTAYTVTVP